MKKIEKFFKNINISINQKHKDETKNKILEFYQPVKRGINLYRPIKFAALAAACLIIVSVTILQFYNKSGFQKRLYSPSLEKYEKIKTGDKESNEKTETKDIVTKPEDDKTGRKYFAEKKDLTDKVTETDDLDALKNEKSAVLSPNKGEAENQLMMKSPVTKIEQIKHINSIQLDNTYKKSLSAVKTDDEKKEEVSETDKSKRSEVREKEEATGTKLKDSIAKTESAADNNYISTVFYNKISFEPNKSVESFHYLNNQLSQKLAVDLENINDEEVINYFTKEDKAESREEVFVEGVLKKENYYYFLISLEPNDYLIKDLTITFNSNVSKFYLYGYNDDIGRVYQAQKNKIRNNHVSIFLILRILYLTEDIGSIEIVQSKNGSVSNINQRIKTEDIKEINSASAKLKKAILGYMILSELKSAEFKKADIIEYKNKTISALPAEIDNLYKNYINFKKD